LGWLLFWLAKEVICLVNTYEDRLARATASLGLAPENTLPRVFFFFAQKWLLQLPFRQGPLPDSAGVGFGVKRRF